jgi:hypothetical protein
MASLDRIGFSKSTAFGALLGTLNLKNLPVTISAGSIFASHQLPVLKILPALVAFCLVGSIGVLIPVVIARVAKQRAEKVLQQWKLWLSANNAVIICLLFLLIGLTALIKGASALL